MKNVNCETYEKTNIAEIVKLANSSQLILTNLTNYIREKCKYWNCEKS